MIQNEYPILLTPLRFPFMNLLELFYRFVGTIKIFYLLNRICAIRPDNGRIGGDVSRFVSLPSINSEKNQNLTVFINGHNMTLKILSISAQGCNHIFYMIVGIITLQGAFYNGYFFSFLQIRLLPPIILFL